MNPAQEIPTTISEITRLGCLFGAPFTPTCYQQYTDHYKLPNASGGVLPTDWREPWHQEGNSCETDDSEQYVSDSDYQQQNVIKTETNNNTMSVLVPKPPSYSAYTPDQFESTYQGPYQPSGYCYGPRGLPEPQLQTAPTGPGHTSGLSSTIKQEPNDRDFDANFRTIYNKCKSPNHNKLIWRQTNSTDKQNEPKSRDPSPDPRPCFQNTAGRRGSLQLWQFLVALLDAPDASAGCIAWTGRGMEFKLIEPEEVARRWGAQKNRPAMNYDKLSRSLRYYYEKGIMQKVAGERYVYKFVCDPDALFNMAYGPHHENTYRAHQITTNGATSANSSKPENLCTKSSNESHHLAYTDMLNFYNCGITHPYQHLQYLHDSKHARYP